MCVLRSAGWGCVFVLRRWILEFCRGHVSWQKQLLWQTRHFSVLPWTYKSCFSCRMASRSTFRPCGGCSNIACIMHYKRIFLYFFAFFWFWRSHISLLKTVLIATERSKPLFAPRRTCLSPQANVNHFYFSRYTISNTAARAIMLKIKKIKKIMKSSRQKWFLVKMSGWRN